MQLAKVCILGNSLISGLSFWLLPVRDDFPILHRNNPIGLFRKIMIMRHHQMKKVLRYYPSHDFGEDGSFINQRKIKSPAPLG